MAFNVNIGATLGLTFASVSMDGSGILNYSQYPGSGSLSFASSSGAATMNIGFQTYANYQISYAGTTTTGDLPLLPNLDFRFADQQSFGSYMLGQVITLSDTADDIPIISAGTSDFDVPDDIVDLSLGVNLTPTLQCQLSGVSLQTSAGTFYSPSDILNLNFNSPSVTVSGISQTTHCSYTALLSPNFTIEASILGLDVFDQNYPIAQPFDIPLPSADISTTPSQSVTFNLSASSTAPVITTVSPAALTGLPLPQTQLIRIIGTGFTSSSTLTFNDGVDPPFTGKVPTFINANELDYNIKVGTNQANWSVQVINGSQMSNLGYFTVNAPPPIPSGSLVVNLAPAGAVLAGAQWQVDGGSYYSSGGGVPVLTPGSHTVSFKPISGYTTPVNQMVTITANTQTTANGAYVAIAPSTYTLTLNYNNTQGAASASPSASGNIYTAGETVQMFASALSGYHFTGWSGDVSGTNNPINFTMSGNKNVTANFATGDPTLGTVIVTIQPPAAATAGVMWGFNTDDYRASGSSYTTFPATYILNLHTVAGWVGPSTMVATLTAGHTANYTATFTPDTTPGLLTVTISPPDVVTAGAQWHLNGSTGQGSGATVQLAPDSGYTITFDSLPGWTAPPSQTVTIQRAQTTVVAGNYTPPDGQPSIVSIQPNVGALAGGTELTIRGLNFTAPATVLVAGQPATNVTVANNSQMTCFTPSNSVYGTAPVVVQTTSGSTTNLTGFAYGVPRGNGITLAGSIGGFINAVAVQGSDCYIGEGSTFTVLDVSNPAAPTPIARLALSGLVQDIALFTSSGHQYAAVADGDAGLQIVDVTVPAAPALRGYYNTGDWANGIAVSNNFAYVANNNSGLVVLDMSNPMRPTLSGSVALPGEAFGIAIQQVTNQLFAYVTTYNALCVVDLSNPNNPTPRGSVSAAGYNASVAVNGNRAYVANYVNRLEEFDISNPDSPQALGEVEFDDTPGAVTVENNQIYAVGYFGLDIFNPVGNSLQRVGSSTGGQHDDGQHMAVTGGYAFCSGGAFGFHIYNVNSPNTPSPSGVFNETIGYYSSVAFNGTTIVAATQNNGLKAFDLSNPANPIFLSQYASSLNSGQTVQLAGSRAYYLSDDQVNIVDMSNPQTPVFLGASSISQFEVVDFYLLGNSIVGAGIDEPNVQSEAGIAIFDASNPASIGIQGTFDFPTQLEAYAVTGNSNIACVAVPSATGSDFSLAVLSVSNPTSLQLIGQIPDIGVVGTMRLAPDNRYLYIGGQLFDPSWKIVDLANSNAPVLVSSNYVGAAVYSFAFSDGTAYLATGTGVLVYDVSNPNQPQLLRSYSTPVRPLGLDTIKVSGDTLYLADASGGLVSLTLSDINPPEVFITFPTSSPIFTNTTGTLNLGGTADDNVGLVQGTVANVTWANSQGGIGFATGTTNWSVTNILLIPGTNILRVTATDMSGNSSNATLTVVYQTTNQNQTITFPAIADHICGDPPMQLAAAASSGLPVTFGIVSGPAVLSSSNVLTLTGAGAVTVEADQSGNGGFNRATPVDMSFNATMANQSIAFAPVPNHSVGDPPFALIATTSSGLAAYFDVLSGPATISNNIVTLLAGGVVTAIASQPGNSNYNAAATVLQTFTVSKIPQTIVFGALSQQKAGDASFSLTATTSSGLPVSFSASGAAVLSGNILTLTGSGNVTVTASQPGNTTYAAAANASQSFFVVPPANTLASVGLLTNGFEMNFYGTVGSNYTLQASTDLKNWTSVLDFTSTNSTMIVIDPGADYLAWRFYRVAQGSLPIVLSLNLNASASWRTNGPTLTLQGPLGFSHTVQVSTDLFNWQPLTNFVLSNSPAYFGDPAATNYIRRFYRAMMPQ
jgi:uncharacterized repeat protein (TIGR02543 family)